MIGTWAVWHDVQKLPINWVVPWPFPAALYFAPGPYLGLSKILCTTRTWPWTFHLHQVMTFLSKVYCIWLNPPIPKADQPVWIPLYPHLSSGNKIPLSSLSFHEILFVLWNIPNMLGSEIMKGFIWWDSSILWWDSSIGLWNNPQLMLGFVSSPNDSHQPIGVSRSRCSERV